MRAKRWFAFVAIAFAAFAAAASWAADDALPAGRDPPLPNTAPGGGAETGRAATLSHHHRGGGRAWCAWPRCPQSRG